jgi:hypothetical protein
MNPAVEHDSIFARRKPITMIQGLSKLAKRGLQCVPLSITLTMLGAFVGFAHAQNMVGAEPHISLFGGRLLAEWRLEYSMMGAGIGALIGFSVDGLRRSHGRFSLRALFIGVAVFCLTEALVRYALL